jgi:site-specific DNA recombinase
LATGALAYCPRTIRGCHSQDRSSPDGGGRHPGAIVRTWRAASLNDQQIDERELVKALQRLDPLWDQLFPSEQARVLTLLVARVIVTPEGLEISLRVEGIGSLVEDLRLHEASERRAA